MNITTDGELLQQIESFIADTGMKPSRFGLDAMGDGALIQQLRSGRSLTLRNASRVIDFMKSFRDNA